MSIQCPACSSKKIKPVANMPMVSECQGCNAIFGSCYLGDSYALVKPFWAETEPPVENLRYFDLECLGSKGLTRRHGWFDVKTRRIVQTG